MMASRFPVGGEVRLPVRVLIVDDMPQVRHDLRQLLELTGQVEIAGEAGDGAEGLRLAIELAPQVILMDLEMPIMNGYEATRRIKESLPAVRVVILSVHSGTAERERANEAGADGFVEKGANYEVLVNAIRGKNGRLRSSGNGKG